MLQPENRSQTYAELFVGIDDGSIKIPKFQRDFVWNLEQTASLIDSLVKGFPIGAFTYWETTDELRHVRDIGNHHLPSQPPGHPVSYVLDGQQRITSLYAVRKGVVYTRQSNESIDYTKISIDLTLDPDSDEPVVYPSEPETNISISIHDLLTAKMATIFKNYESDEQLEKIEIYKTRLEGYSFPLVIIGKHYPIDIATEVFTRINTGGTGLDLFEIMVAKTYSEERKFDLLDEYEKLIGDDSTAAKCLARVHYETVDSATVLRCVAIHLRSDTRRKEILRLDKNDFIDAWPIVKKGIFSAVTFTRKTLRIPVSKLLPYDALLVPLVYFFIRNERPTNDQKQMLKEYFFWASMTNRFSGAVDTSLTADHRRMDAILNHKNPSYRGEEVGISEEELINLQFSAGEARSKAILCIYSYFKPRSFDTDEDVTIDNSWLQRADSKNYHHFFPRAYLYSKDWEPWYANSILNITIVDDYLNKRRIRAQPPSNYMSEFEHENQNLDDTMKSHLISNLERFGVWDDDYDLFLKRRAVKVLRELRKRLPEDT